MTSVSSQSISPAGLMDPAKQIRLMIVDDEAAILASLKRIFRGRPYQLVSFDNAPQAIEYLQNNPDSIDVIISDMRMPGMDGLEFLTKVSQTWPDIMRLVLSGYADMESVIKVVNQANLHSYVTKPWDEVDLKLKVQQAAEQRYLKFTLRQLQAERQAELEAVNASLEDKINERTSDLLAAKESLRQTIASLEDSHRGAVKMIAYFAEQGWQSLQPHSEAVAKMTARFVRFLGLDKKMANDIVVAARLHDIGLAVLDQKIVHKPVHEQTDKEREIYRKHAILGENTLMGMPVMVDVAKIVRHHHESFNGDGYPDKLSGENIPFGARIIRLVNDYENMLDGLRYEHAYSPDEALDVIRQNSFEFYDPKLVTAFVKMMSSDQDSIDGNQQIWSLTPDELKPGMELYENLVSLDGMILLTAGQVLNERLINRIHHVEKMDGKMSKIAVLVNQD